MARAKEPRNGALEAAFARLVHSQAALDGAMATLVQNQAAFLARSAETDARISEMNRVNSERFARIEAILLEHSRILRELPDAVREKIGFKPPQQP